MTVTSPWHVDALELSNFRCFEDYRIDFDPNLTVLVGINGVGKTAILDAVAIMLSTVLREFGGKTRGFSSSDARLLGHDLDSKSAVARLEGQYPVSSTIEATISGSELWWRRERSSQSGRTTWGEKNTEVGNIAKRLWQSLDDPSGEYDGHNYPLPVIALYGVDRVAKRRDVGYISQSRSAAYDAALEGTSDLSRLSKFIEALTLDEFEAFSSGSESGAASRAQLDAIRLATNEILAGTGWQNPRWSAVAKELTLENETHGIQPLSFLSSGIRITAGLVIDLASRAARANPNLGARDLLNRVPGIALIDEVDLHLHPQWQQNILPQLRHIFPNIQFIVTTHSPQVLSTVEAHQILILEDSGYSMPNYSEGLRSDVILERIMGTDAEPSLQINAILNQYLRLVDAGDGQTKNAEDLRATLEDSLGGIANVPKLADADAQMAFYDLDL